MPTLSYVHLLMRYPPSMNMSEARHECSDKKTHQTNNPCSCDDFYDMLYYKKTKDV